MTDNTRVEAVSNAIFEALKPLYEGKRGRIEAADFIRHVVSCGVDSGAFILGPVGTKKEPPEPGEPDPRG